MLAKTTLKKISEQLNLSVSTVSRALKDHPDIAESTKEKVRELARQLEYEPNTYAINLRTNSSHIIGLVVPGIANLFYESFIAAAERKARQQGYTLMILQSGDDPVLEAENLKICRLNRVAGVLLCTIPGADADAYRKLEEAAIPVIFFDKVPEGNQYNTVCLADTAAARLAADTLLQYGKERVLCLFGASELSITRRRESAFKERYVQAAASSILQIEHCSSSEAARAVCLSYLEPPSVDAIFAMSDELLIGAMQAIYESNIRVPEQVSVLALSNGFLPALFNPRITYIETSGSKLGEAAIQRLLDYTAGQKFTRSIEVPSALIHGRSLA